MAAQRLHNLRRSRRICLKPMSNRFRRTAPLALGCQPMHPTHPCGTKKRGRNKPTASQTPKRGYVLVGDHSHDGGQRQQRQDQACRRGRSCCGGGVFDDDNAFHGGRVDRASEASSCETGDGGGEYEFFHDVLQMLPPTMRVQWQLTKVSLSNVSLRFAELQSLPQKEIGADPPVGVKLATLVCRRGPSRTTGRYVHYTGQYTHWMSVARFCAYRGCRESGNTATTDKAHASPRGCPAPAQ